MYAMIQLTVHEDASGDRVAHGLTIYETECLNEEQLDAKSRPAYIRRCQRGRRSSRSSRPAPRISSRKSRQSGGTWEEGAGCEAGWGAAGAGARGTDSPRGSASTGRRTTDNRMSAV
jgi:hypothetical protein